MSASEMVPRTTGAAPESPYKGLVPFDDSELDALFFFGRENEREVIIANLLASRLTVLYGPSGVGKSSLLHAGVAYELRRSAHGSLIEHGHPEFVVATFANWSEDPVAGIRAAASDALESLFGAMALAETPAEKLANVFETWTSALGCELLLILDQVEEYFLYHEHEAGPNTFAEQLPDLVTRAGPRTSVLLTIREDALAKLDFFKRRIPLLFSNYLRLDHLDRDSARRAITGPIERYNALASRVEPIAIEPRLVDRVLEEVAAGTVTEGRGRGIVRMQTGTQTRVEAPYLQLVMQRLWEVEREDGSSLLRLPTLERLGGASRITEEHLERALAELTPSGRDAAARMFHHLITPSGTKIAHRTEDLAEYAGVPLAQAVDVVRMLSTERILRPIDGVGEAEGGAHEIFHDVLADAVATWRARHETERTLEAERRRRRRAFQIAAAALTALAVMSTVAVYALVQRSEARESARDAQAGELTARAFALVDFDPQRSLELATRAADLARDDQLEPVLRRALRNARLRRTIDVGEPIVAADYGNDGSVLLAGKNGALVVAGAGRAPRKIHVAGGRLVTARFHPTSPHILAATEAGASIIDARTGRTTANVPSDSNLTSASFGPEGEDVVTTSARGALSVWRSRDGRRVTSIRVGTRALKAVLARGGYVGVAVADEEGHVQPALYRGRRLIRVLPQRGLSDLEFTPDGRFLATASRDGTTILWRVTDGRLVHTFDDGGGPIAALDVSRDGELLATASSDGAVRVWTLEGPSGTVPEPSAIPRVRANERPTSPARLFYFVGHSNPVTSVSFDPSGMHVASGSEDRTARIWTVQGIGAGGDPAILIGHGSGVTALAYAPRNAGLVTGSEDGKGRIWEAQIEEKLRVVARMSGVEATARTPTGAIAARAGRVVTIHSGTTVLGTFHVAGTLAEFSVDGRYVASASDRVVRVQELPDGQTVATFRAPSRISALALRSDARELVTAGVDGSLVIWDIRGGGAASRFRAVRSIGLVALSPDGDLAVAVGSDGQPRVVSRAGRLLHVLRGHPGDITDLHFDPSGARIVTAAQGSSENLMTWNAETGRRLNVFVGHFGTVSAASFSPDGRWIASAGPIAGALWPAGANRPFMYVRGPADLLTDIIWSAEGFEIVASSRDGTIRTYSCRLCRPLDDLLAMARDRLAASS